MKIPKLKFKTKNLPTPKINGGDEMMIKGKVLKILRWINWDRRPHTIIEVGKFSKRKSSKYKTIVIWNKEINK